jgi:hypothetical protein
MKKYLILGLLALAVGCAPTKIQTRYVYVREERKPRAISNLIEGTLLAEDDPRKTLLYMKLSYCVPDTIPSLVYRDSLLVIDEQWELHYVPKKETIGTKL